VKASVAAVAILLLSGCGGSSSGGTPAQQRGVGAGCSSNADCTQPGLVCLTQFKGGYCGLQGCVRNADCPSGSACVAYTDGNDYCFATCADKPSCNVNRPADLPANCSSSVTFVEAGTSAKACLPPS
jgi:hypothetical protein